MRAALQGRPAVTPAGMQVAPPPRPATKVLDVPLPPAVTNMFVPGLVPRVANRKRNVLVALAVLAVLIVIPLAMALDSSSSHASGKSVTTSTPVPVPAGNPAPPPPPPAATQQPPVQPWHGPR